MVICAICLSAREIKIVYYKKDWKSEQTQDYATNIMSGADSCKIQVKRVKLKKRTGLFSRIINDFDKTEISGFRCLTTFIFTNCTPISRTVDQYCFCLIDDLGNEYNEIDSETQDYRRDELTGPVSTQPNMPMQLKLTFVVPDNTKAYNIKFKGFK